MTWQLYTVLAVIVLAVLLVFAQGRKLLVYVLLALDRCVNVLLGGIWRETLSSRAHRMRAKRHKWWGWTANAIDAVFAWDPDHCRRQHWREVAMGWHQ